ncbi:MAG: hypothetical protein KGL39_31590 [Patescibacteria group bacterium]|nr:hypothetical protein [Patescibacteria group bacterium]
MSEHISDDVLRCPACGDGPLVVVRSSSDSSEPVALPWLTIECAHCHEHGSGIGPDAVRAAQSSLRATLG